MSPVEQFTSRIRQRWTLIVALAVIGGLAAAVWSISSAVTQWTGTTALTTQSQNRSPDQDGVLALGYVDYFNNASYQALLRGEANIPAGVTLAAKTAATSPVFYISATAPAQEQARQAAIDAATRFRADIRDSLVIERQQAATDLQAEIDRNVQLVQTPGRTDAEKNVILDQIRSLQGVLTETEADNTNHVKTLQPEPGMSVSTPSSATDIAAGVVGGAVLGVLLAMLLAAVDRRLRTRADVQQRVGLKTLADLAGARGNAAERARRMANLANALDVAGGKTIAIVAARRTVRSAELARNLAGTVAARQAAFRSTGGYRVSPSGEGATGDSTMPTARFNERVEQASLDGVVVIDAPSLLDTAESQVVCAAADEVVLLVESGRSLVADVREAVALLEAVHARVAGVVIDTPLRNGRTATPAEPLEQNIAHAVMSNGFRPDRAVARAGVDSGRANGRA